MIIDLRTLPDDQKDLYFSLDRDWWRPDGDNDPILSFDGPLQVKMKIYRAGDKFVLDGELSGALRLVCNRCLEAYHRGLRSEFEVFLALPLPETGQTEFELVEGDMNVDFIRGEEIDLDDIIREQIYLTLPIKSLCGEKCRGLCPSCGTNLNEGACECCQRQGHAGFSKLKNLKIVDRS